MKKNNRQSRRNLTQLIASVLYNFNIKGFATGNIYQGQLKGMCVPSLNCYSCPGAIMSCPLGTLQNGISSIKIKFPYYILGLVLLFSVILARFICGHLCPVGFFQDLLYKIEAKKIRKSKLTRKLSIFKYIVLIVFVIIIPIIFRFPSFCKFICPAGIGEAAIPIVISKASVYSLITGLFRYRWYTLKMFILIFIVVSAIFIYRVFCRFICPLGAIYSLFNKISFIRMDVDKNLCDNCNTCIKICPMDIKEVGDRECIMCERCIDKCPKSAINIIKIVNVNNKKVCKIN